MSSENEFRFLHSRDLAALSKLSHELNLCADLDELSIYAGASLHRLVPSDVVIWNEFTLEGEILSVRTFPKLGAMFLQSQCAAFARYAGQHPVFSKFQANPTGCLIGSVSDYCSLNAFKEMAVYREHNRNVSGEDHLVMTSVVNNEAGFAFSFYRSKKFRRSEKAFGQIALRALLNAYRRQIEIREIEQKLELIFEDRSSLESAWLETSLELQPYASSPECDSFLRKHFGEGVKALVLPSRLKRAIQPICREIGAAKEKTIISLPVNGGDILCELEQLAEDSVLRIKLFAKSGLTDISKLTPVEQEVLFWVLKGKTNPEIAILRSCSPKTIERNVTSIFEKLGFSSRSQLMTNLNSEY